MSKSFQMFKKRCGKVIITAGLIVATTVSVYADNTALANANVETGTKTKVEKVLAQNSKITIKVGKVKVGNSRLNVRNKASLSGKIIGKLYTGNKVEIVGENSNWYEINYKGGTAYISKKYVKTSSTTVTEVEDCSDVFKAQINFNVRTGPSTSYTKIGKLVAGQVFQVTGKCSNGWYQIKFGSKVGYISSKYLDEMEQGSTDPEVIGTAKVNTKSTKDQYLAIRAGQGTHTALLDNSKTGDVLEILADKSPVKGWTKVRYNNLNGYAYTKWLEIGETPVKDEAPVVTSKDSITLNVGDKFEIKDLDLKVIDKEDGDITNKATIDASDVDTSKPGQYWVKVSVIDSHGNTVTKLIGVKVVEKAPAAKENQAPVITSKNRVTIKVGHKLEITDLDLKVIDAEDGDITNKATIDASKVNINKPGEYWVSIVVSDSDGTQVTKLIGVDVVE